MRVATWNLDAAASPGARQLLSELRADVLLLTEVPAGFDLPGYQLTALCAPLMDQDQHYAAVACRIGLSLVDLGPPTPTSAAAQVNGVTYVSTVLPWGFSSSPPYRGRAQAQQTVNAVEDLAPFLAAQPALVWGGDWNHPLTGSLQGFTRAGHQRIQRALDELGLTAHTASELAREGCGSIDHIASRHRALPVQRVPAAPYSPHDAYVVDLPDDDGHQGDR